MSETTYIPNGGLVTFSIKIDGSLIPDEDRVVSIDIEFAVNRISAARITLRDGEVSKGMFYASSSSTYVPGGKVSIELGYNAMNTKIFEGLICAQNVQINNAVGSVLVVECRDAAVAMIVGRKSLTFSNKTDSDIISSILGNYSGVSSLVTTTATQWPQQVQNYATDWDFMLSRAETNGLIVTVVNGKVSVMKPDEDTTSVLTLTYGNDIYELNADLNAVTQLGSVKASSWDYVNQVVVTGNAENEHTGPGNLSSKKLSEVIGLSEYQLQTAAALTQEDLTNWSKAQLVKSEYSKIRGTVKFEGTSKVSLGKYITLTGVGDRFSGDHLISGVVHTVSDGIWSTEVTFGLSPNWFTEEPDVMAPPATGLLPGVNGLFNGTVKKMYEDPDDQFRILVTVPLFDQNGEGIWARLSNFYSTKGAGAFFFPEVGDEVVVGFLNDDPRFPVILGSLYSGSNNEPFEGLSPDEDNTIKAIVSKSGIEIEFDDKNKILTIKTPENNTAIFSDQDKQITIKDQNNNSIVLSDNGIVMQSPKDINITADQNLTLKGTQGVTIESSGGDVSVSGANIKQSADSQYSAEGGATAQIQGGGELTLKGAMVMIN